MYHRKHWFHILFILLRLLGLGWVISNTVLNSLSEVLSFSHTRWTIVVFQIEQAGLNDFQLGKAIVKFPDLTYRS